MKQWDIWTCEFAEARPHPAIIVSHPARVARAPLVNVLFGSGQKAARPAGENAVVLNRADRLDWVTLVKGDLIYLVEKERLGDVAMATNPFELFHHYAMRIEARSAAPLTMLVRICAGHSGHLPIERAVPGRLQRGQVHYRPRRRRSTRRPDRETHQRAFP